MAFTIKGKKLVGTKKKDKIKWASYPILRRNLTVKAGKGNDVIDFRKSKYKNKLYGEAGKDNIKGGKKTDKIYGGSGNDKLYGYAGNDIIKGGSGNDLIKGGTGNDKLYGEKGTNKIYGEAGNDSIWAGTGTDLIYGGAGNDVISLAKGGKNTVYGQDGDDRVNGGAGTDYIDGGAGNDILNGVAGTNTIIGGTGNDTLYSGTGVDTFRFYSGSGSDVVYNATSLDKIEFLGAVDNVEYADDGDDLVITRTTGTVDDTIRIVGYATAEDKIDSIFYNGETRKISDEKGGEIKGDDDGNTLEGDDKPNVINGYGGNDTINGKGGNDTIDGGADNDLLTGGEGADTFVFTDTFGKDTITDYSFADGDNIDITGKTLDNLTFERVYNPSSNYLVIKSGDNSIKIEGYNDSALRINGEEVSAEVIKAKTTLVFDLSSKSVSEISFSKNGINLNGDLVINGYFETMKAMPTVVKTANGDKELYDFELIHFLNNNTYNPTQFTDVIRGGGYINSDYLYDGNNHYRIEAGNEFVLERRTDYPDRLFVRATSGSFELLNFNFDHTAEYDIKVNGESISNVTLNVILKKGVAYTATGYNEVFTGKGSVSGITSADSISFENAKLRRNGNDNTLIVTDDGANEISVNYDFTTANETVKVGDDLVSYADTLYVALGGATYTATEYIEEFSGSGTVHGMSDSDKIIVNGTPTFSRTNDGPLVVSGTDSAITVSDFNFNGTRYINVNDSTTAGMTLKVTLDNFEYTPTKYAEEISGVGTLNARSLGSGDKLVFASATKYTLTATGTLNISAGTQSITLTEAYPPYDSLPVYVGEDADVLSTKVLYVEGIKNFDGSGIRGFKALNITGTSDDESSIIGGATNDTIDGGGGNDIITGGAGNDSLSGGAGGDTFVFESGSGDDIITDATNTDKIKFLGTVNNGDITYDYIGNDLIITRKNGSVTDTIKVLNYFITPEDSRLDIIEFENGTTLSISENATINRSGSGYIEGTPFKDNITGSAGSDTIKGLASGDILTGNGGADTYIFADTFGNDTITDYSTEDNIQITSPTYLKVFTHVGSDYIKLLSGDNSVTLEGYDGANITVNGATSAIQFDNVLFDYSDVENVTFSRSGYDLVINDGTKSIWIENYFTTMSGVSGFVKTSTAETPLSSVELAVSCDDFSPSAFKDVISGTGTLDATDLYNDSNYTIDVTEPVVYSRTNEGPLVINGEITVSNFNFEGGTHNINVNDATTAGMTINVTLDTNLTEPYSPTAYAEKISGVGSVSNLGADDKLVFGSTPTFTLDGSESNLVISDGTNTITVTDYANDKAPKVVISDTEETDLPLYSATLIVRNISNYDATGTVFGSVNIDGTASNDNLTGSVGSDEFNSVGNGDNTSTLHDIVVPGSGNDKITVTEGGYLQVNLSRGVTPNDTDTIYDVNSAGHLTLSVDEGITAIYAYNDEGVFKIERRYDLGGGMLWKEFTVLDDFNYAENKGKVYIMLDGVEKPLEKFYTGSKVEDMDDDGNKIIDDGGDTINHYVAGDGDNNGITITGEGNNTIDGGNGNDTINIDGSGDNTIIGGDEDTTSGGDSIGDNISINGGGNNTVDGGSGNDTINITGNGGNTINGGDDRDRITVNGDGNNSVTGGSGSDTINVSGGGSNTIIGGEDTTGGGNDGNNEIVVSGEGYFVIYGGNGDDVIDGRDAAKTLIYGLGGNDEIYTGKGENITDGGDGNDAIVAYGTGNVIVGGNGADNISFDFDRDSISESLSGGTIYGGNPDGSDDASNTIEVRVNGSVEINAGNGHENPVTGERIGDSITVGYWQDGEDPRFYGDYNVIGGIGNDTINANEANSVSINGGDGDDLILGSFRGNSSLVGGAGADEIIAYSGGNIIDGGSGNDGITIGKVAAQGSIFEGGSNTIRGGAGTDQIRIVDSVETEDTLLFYKGDGNDLIEASNDLNAAEDTLNFCDSHIDELNIDIQSNGSSGYNLVIKYNNNTDSVTIKDYDSTCSIKKVTYLNDDDESITVTMDEFIRLRNVIDVPVDPHNPNQGYYKGNAFAEAINGTNMNDVISGAGGNDSISGNGGDDTIEGAAGNDYIDGGEGADILYGDNADGTGAGNDHVIGGAGTDKLYGGDGKDILHGGSEDDSLYGGTGDDELYGEAGDDELYGEAGDDLLNGGAGNNVLYFDGDSLSGNDTIVSGGGNDTIIINANVPSEDDPSVYSKVGNDLVITTYNDGENTSSITLQDYFTVGGGHSAQTIEYTDDTINIRDLSIYQSGSGAISGTEFNDIISGSGDVDEITNVGDGNDSQVINGKVINDIILPGGGDDSISVVEGGKVMVQIMNNTQDGSGNDTIFGAANAENVVLNFVGVTSSNVAGYQRGSDYIIQNFHSDGNTISSEKITLENFSYEDDADKLSVWFNAEPSDWSANHKDIPTDKELILAINGSYTGDSADTTSNNYILGDVGRTAADEIYAYGATNVIKTGSGTDQIYAYGVTSNDIETTDGNDRIEVYNGDNTIKASGNQNAIYVKGVADADITLSGESNNVTLQSAGTTVVNAAGTNNNYTIEGGKNTINGAVYDDATISGGENELNLLGIDTINITGGQNTINVANDDTIAGTVTVNITSDSTNIINDSDKVNFYNLQSGNNTLYLHTDSNDNRDSVTISGGVNTINGTEYTDSFSIVGGVNTFNLGAGDDTININFASTNTISLGDGKDVVNLNQSGFDSQNEIDFGDGDEGFQVLYDSTNTIWGGNGKDTIYATRGNNTIYGGVKPSEGEYTGEDTDVNDIRLGSGNNVVYLGNGVDAEKVVGDETISYRKGDTVSQVSDYGNATIYGGLGDDLINVTALGSAQIYAGEGDDTITGSNTANTIEGGAGKDSITAVNASEIDGGADDDYIKVTGSGNAISGGSGADYIKVTGSDNIILGGTGADTVDFDLTDDTTNTVVFNTGDGADTINYATSGTTLKFNNITSLDELTPIFDSVNGSGVTLELQYSGNSTDKVVLTDIKNTDKNLVISYNGGNDTITLSQMLEDKHMYMPFAGTSEAIVAGEGNDTIWAYSGTITGGLGNDSMTQVSENNIKYNFAKTGDGDDVINNYVNDTVKGYQWIQFTGFDSLNTGEIDTFKGNITFEFSDDDNKNLVITYGNGSTITINNYDIFNNSNKFAFTDANGQVIGSTIDAPNFIRITRYVDEGVEFRGDDNIGNNIIGTQGNDIINPGARTNYITLGEGSDTVKITNYGEEGNYLRAENHITLGTDSGEDTLWFTNLSGASNLSISKWNNDLMLSYKTNSGSNNDVVYLSNFFTQTLANLEAQEALRIKFGEDGDSMTLTAFGELKSYSYIINDGNVEMTDTVVGTVFNDNITTRRGHSETIYSGIGNDTINTSSDTSVSTGADVIYAGAGNDSIAYEKNVDNGVVIYGDDGNDIIRISAGKAYGGAGSDTIKIYNDTITYPNASNELRDQVVTIYGGTADHTGEDAANDNDVIEVVAGSNTFTGKLEIHGGAGTNSITGGKNDDTIYGADKVDIIKGGDGNDSIYGYGGNDILIGNQGNDIIDGGDGDDTIYSHKEETITTFDGKYSGSSEIRGGDGDDVIRAFNETNVVWGDEGDDIIYTAKQGNTEFHFANGDGNDTIYSSTKGSGSDGIYLDDIVFDGTNITGVVDTVGKNDITIYYGSYNDETGWANSITIKNYLDGYGFDSDDRRKSSIQYIYDSEGNAIPVYSIIKTTAQTGVTNNTSYTMFADNITYGAAGTYNGGLGDDTLIGSSGNDKLYGDDGADSLVGGLGKDTLLGKAGDDILYGGEDDDNVSGDLGNDTLYGDAGNDTITGGNGDDYLNGGTGKNWLMGDSGNDTLVAGYDSNLDTLSGGAGADTYVLKSAHTDSIVAKIDGGGSFDDIIEFESANSFSFVRDGNDLHVVFKEGTNLADTLLMPLWFDNPKDFTVKHGETTTSLMAMMNNDNCTGFDGVAIYSGDTRVVGDGTEHTIYGSSGNDSIFAYTLPTDGACTIYGGAGADNLRARSFDDVIFTGSKPADLTNINNLVYSEGYVDMYEGFGEALISANVETGNGNNTVYSFGENIYEIKGGVHDDTYHTMLSNNVYINDDSHSGQNNTLTLHSIGTGEQAYVVMPVGSTEDVYIVNYENYQNWFKNGGTFSDGHGGVKLTSNTMRSITDSTGRVMGNITSSYGEEDYSCKLDKMREAITSWIGANTGYSSVADVLAYGTDEQKSGLIAKFGDYNSTYDANTNPDGLWTAV